VIHLVTPYGRDGPSSRVRVWEWSSRLAAEHAVTAYIGASNSSPSTLAGRPLAVLAAEKRLRAIARSRPERLLLHREASPLSRGGLESELLRQSAYAVYDFDDALQWDWGEGAIFRRLAPKAPKANAAIRLADRVIAGNPVLADWASDHHDDVVVVPSCIAHELYLVKADYMMSDPPRLVWIGSADNEHYLRVIEVALREIHRRTGARLTLLSRTKRTLGSLEGMIDRIPWSEHVQHARLRDFDLALAPLPDEPYTRGKSGYKLLQYAAAGLPFVGSPIGVNEPILAELGMPSATTDDEWLDAITELISSSPDERRRLGAHARDVVTRGYSYDAWLDTWQELVIGARDRRGAHVG